MKAQDAKPKRPVVWRIAWCAGASVLAALLPMSWWAFKHENTAVSVAVWLMAILALLPTVLLTLNLAAFPWDYSMFGSLRRTAAPMDSEGVRLRGGIVIGRYFRQTWPGVHYLFHPLGLGLNSELVGTAFVPAENITRITRRRSPSQLLIEHNFRESRGPLLLFCPGLSTIEPDLPGWFRENLRPSGSCQEAQPKEDEQNTRVNEMGK